MDLQESVHSLTGDNTGTLFYATSCITLQPDHFVT